MIIDAIRTPLIKAGANLNGIIAENIPTLREESVVVIASKLFSTCENRFVPKITGSPEEKQALIKKEADSYTEPHSSKYGLMMTINRNILFVNAGIDESNADGDYILWPEDPQKSVNEVWRFLRSHYGLTKVGVTMSDSASFMLNWGVVGRAIAYCGFNPLRSYVGKPDLFGKIMQMEKTNVMHSLTDAAVLEMGEGAEQQPMAVVSQISQIEWQDHEPTAEELAALKIEIEDDAFAPLLGSAPWHHN